ncbi:MAG: patatin-like phospholipase family protein [Gemmatimonadota bacterium]
MLRFWKGETKEERGAPEAGPVLGGVALGARPWLVLGGGGLKGLTHLGALKVLREAGFEPTGIIGTSIGALVGAAVASGADLDELIARARGLSRGDIARIDRRAVWVNGIRSESFFRETPLRDYLAGALPGSWEEFEIRFQANSVELGSGRTEWFGIGARTDVTPVEAIYASAALPVFYPPARLPGGVYMDGGAEYALPLHRAAELGATGIVAIDPGAHQIASAEAVAAGGMLAIHERVFSIMSGRVRRQTVDEWEGPPLLYLRPELEGYGSFDFAHVRYFLEEGERKARAALGMES